MKKNNLTVWNSEKLESIAQLSSALAHEIRNPITAAKGFMQLIASNDFDDEKKKEFALISISEIDRAENIIKDFLTYSKPKIKKVENVCLADEVKKILLILEPLANQNAVQVLLNNRSDGTIRAENSFIQQCLLNLCKNAIEAMENGGTLTIYIFEDIDHIYVNIHDTGVGMSEEQLKQLGKPFFSTKGEKGTGPGLMTAYGLLKKINGTVQVSSKLGIGTTFSLSFPLTKEQQEQIIY